MVPFAPNPAYLQMKSIPGIVSSDGTARTIKISLIPSNPASESRGEESLSTCCSRARPHPVVEGIARLARSSSRPNRYRLPRVSGNSKWLVGGFDL